MFAVGKLAQLPVQAVPLLLEVAADLSLEPSEITMRQKATIGELHLTIHTWDWMRCLLLQLIPEIGRSCRTSESSPVPWFDRQEGAS